MKKQIAVTTIFDKNYKANKPVICNIGGARSGKSFAILQLLLQKFISEDHKEILIARKTLPSLRITAYKVFIDLLQDYGYYSKCTHNKSNLTVKYKSNTVYFVSIDDSEKLKSAEFNYVFLEEASELSYLDFMIIKMRMSAQTPKDQPNRIYIAINPSDEFGWIPQRLTHQDDVQVIHSVYNDNPFLDSEYRKILEDLKNTDPELYQIYALGEYATLSNIIYQNYVIDKVFPTAFHDEFYGLDFGYNHPAALTWIGARDSEMYVKEIIYQTHLTNPDLIDQMNECKVHKKLPIYADSAEPKSIEDIAKAGYNIHPAMKNVMDGIKTVKAHKLHIHHESVNLIKEIRTYKWRQDRNGNNLDEPVKFNDDLLDSTRYAIATHYGAPKKRKVVTPRGH